MIITNQEYRQALMANYQDGNTGRTKPAVLPDYPIGTWRLDDLKLNYGILVDELQLLDPCQLHPSEDPFQGRGDDVYRYAEWMEQGLIPPPIECVEVESKLEGCEQTYLSVLKQCRYRNERIDFFTADRLYRENYTRIIKITNGHRRWAAAKLLNKPIRAWVSWSVPTGNYEYHSRRPNLTGLTRELAGIYGKLIV